MRRFLPYTAVLVLLAAAWSWWTIYSRNTAIREAAERAEQKAKDRVLDSDRKVVDAYGGDQLTILTFAANVKQTSPGGRVLLCYGVNNATRVRIEPGVEPIKPAITHCLEVFPKKTTTYKLTAEDDKGGSKTVALTVRVQ